MTVTRFGLGTGPLGGWPTAVPPETARATIRRAWDAGVRYFDTAPLYGYGLSEQHLGHALAGQPRSAFTLSTKVGRLLAPGLEADPLFKGTPDLRPVFDFSASAVYQSLAASRDRLGMHRLDIALIHDPDDHLPEAVAAAYPALAELRRDGVIGALGVGTTRIAPVERFVAEADLDCFLLAGRYTLLEQDCLPLLEVAAARRISVIAAGVFNSGLLVDPAPGATYDYEPAPEPLVRRAQRLAATCARFGVPLRAAAIQFPLAHPAVTTVVVGARSPAEVDDNLDLLQRTIPPELWVALREEGLIRPDAPIPQPEKGKIA